MPFPELIGSTKHEIKQHMSGCKVVRLPTTARVWGVRLSTLYLTDCELLKMFCFFLNYATQLRKNRPSQLIGLSDSLLLGWKMHRVRGEMHKQTPRNKSNQRRDAGAQRSSAAWRHHLWENSPRIAEHVYFLYRTYTYSNILGVNQVISWAENIRPKK